MAEPSPWAAAQSWRALPCFIVWAGPNLIPLSASWTKWGPHSGERGPAALGGKQGGPLHQTWEGPRCGVQSGTKRSALRRGGVQAAWG